MLNQCLLKFTRRLHPGSATELLTTDKEAMKKQHEAKLPPFPECRQSRKKGEKWLHPNDGCK